MRYPAVSGLFYPSSKAALEKTVRGLLQQAEGEGEEAHGAVSLVCPHAGYVYSGKTAAAGFAACKGELQRQGVTIVIIGPNHTGIAHAKVGLSTEKWQTPLGACEADLKFADALQKCANFIKIDEAAHASEHSIEVMLPFLQMLCPQAKYAFLCMGAQSWETAQALGKAVFEAQKETGRKIFVLASSDFTHYESAQSARMKDSAAISLLEKMQPEEFEALVAQRDLSICGHSPIAAALHYARLCKAKTAKVLQYSNSGETSRDFSGVVGYAAIAFLK